MAGTAEVETDIGECPQKPSSNINSGGSTVASMESSTYIYSDSEPHFNILSTGTQKWPFIYWTSAGTHFEI